MLTTLFLFNTDGDIDGPAPPGGCPNPPPCAPNCDDDYAPPPPNPPSCVDADGDGDCDSGSPNKYNVAPNGNGNTSPSNANDNGGVLSNLLGVDTDN